jgi:hypothetical protein
MPKRMAPINQAFQKNLFWYQPRKVLHLYELRSESEVYASLLWNRSRNPAAVESTASAVSDKKGWTFTYNSLLPPRITARYIGTAAPQGVFNFTQLQQGVLSTQEMDEFIWLSSENCHAWLSRDPSETLITYTEYNNRSNNFTSLSITQELWSNQHLMFLILIGWFVILLIKENTSFYSASQKNSYLILQKIKHRNSTISFSSLNKTFT